MKKLLLSTATLAMVFASTSNAATFVNGDGSNYSEVCIAATVSDEAMKAKAAEFGYSSGDLRSFNCNGLSLEKFGKKYRGKASDASKPMKIYAFTAEDDSKETQLCVAAATSKEMLEQVKKELYGSKSAANVSCNGMSLKEFAKRYSS